MENYNPLYDDCYFSEEGGLDESVWVFVRGNRVNRFSLEDDIYTGETGFGSGLNLIALSQYISSEMSGYSGTVDYYSCEKYPLTPERVETLFAPFLNRNEAEFKKYLEFYSMLFENLEPGENCFKLDLFSVKIKFTLYYGDVENALSSIIDNRDIWFLDGHDPEKNPDMWSDEVFSLICSKSHTGTTLSSYTACGMVKKGLRKAGFFIKRGKGYGKKRHMIMGEYLSTE